MTARIYDRTDRSTINGLHQPVADTLRMICGYVAVHGVMPTIEQIMAACGCSRGLLLQRFAVLEARGWVRRAGNRYGRFELTGKVWAEPDGRGQLLDAVVIERFGPDARRSG